MHALSSILSHKYYSSQFQNNCNEYILHQMTFNPYLRWKLFRMYTLAGLRSNHSAIEAFYTKAVNSNGAIFMLISHFFTVQMKSLRGKYTIYILYILYVLYHKWKARPMCPDDVYLMTESWKRWAQSVSWPETLTNERVKVLRRTYYYSVRTLIKGGNISYVCVCTFSAS